MEWSLRAMYTLTELKTTGVSSFLGHTVRMGFCSKIQDRIFRRKRLSTGANFVHVYIEIGYGTRGN